MAEKMFDGFDHTQHKAEVNERWGTDAYTSGDAWWASKSSSERAAWKNRLAELTDAWVAAASKRVSPDSPAARELAQRHIEWLRSVPGTPASAPGGDLKGYVIGLGEMYVADERFGANYATADGGRGGAEFVRDAPRGFAEAEL